MENNEKLIAACWAMWSAIQQAQAVDIYNEAINSLAKIAKEAMTRCGQIDSRIHPNVDCYRYMSRMENLDAILAWDAKSNGVD